MSASSTPDWMADFAYGRKHPFSHSLPHGFVGPFIIFQQALVRTTWQCSSDVRARSLKLVCGRLVFVNRSHDKFRDQKIFRA